MSYTYPYDFLTDYKRIETIHKVNPSTGLYTEESVAGFGFEFERASSMIVNLWLLPLCLITLASNSVYLFEPDHTDRSSLGYFCLTQFHYLAKMLT